MLTAPRRQPKPFRASQHKARTIARQQSVLSAPCAHLLACVLAVRRLGNQLDIPPLIAARSLSWLMQQAKKKLWVRHHATAVDSLCLCSTCFMSGSHATAQRAASCSMHTQGSHAPTGCWQVEERKERRLVDRVTAVKILAAMTRRMSPPAYAINPLVKRSFNITVS